MARKEHIVVGLDIGTTKICAIVAEVTENLAINIIGVGSSPSRGLRKGVIINIESTVESIKKAVEEAELMAAVQINSVFIGIAGSHISSETAHGVVALKRHEVFRADVQRAVETARCSAVVSPDRRVLHVLPREFIVDAQEGIREPVGISGSRLEVDVHIVTGAITSAQNLMKCVNRAGLDVVDIVLQPLASSEAVLTEEEKELGVVMVDLGGGTTDLAFFSEGSISHSAVLPVGGQHLTSDMQIGLRTSQADAEKIKIRHGVALTDMVMDTDTLEVPSVGGRPPRAISKRVLTDIIEPRVEEIFDLVGREIRRAGYEGKLAAGAVITGGTSLLEGMPDAAERVLDLPVRRGVPTGVGGLRDIVSHPMFATGVGLILHARRMDHQFEKVGFLGSRNGGERLGGILDRIKGWAIDFF
ncbi:MAG: cell division protein FtsA [Nitrospinae bacterium]|nr:cell division protein FtsA [Nitrospinota bacterium]MEC4670520.1 cell division protein FtsA [Nitrospirota bacterium]